MAADLTTVQKKVTEILNASAAGSFSATIDTNNYDRVADDITEACRESAFLIARAILSNPNHVHRGLFIPDSPLALTHGGEMPDMAGEGDLIEIQNYTDEAFRVGTPRSVQEISDYRLNTSLLNSVYGTAAHNASNSPLAGYYAIANGRFYFTGSTARGYFPVINRAATLGTAGVAQVETVTIDNGVSENNTATMVVTAAGMPNSPKTVTTSLTSGSHGTAALVATACATALNNDVDVSAWFTASTSTADLIITAKQARANDTTMNLSFSCLPGDPPTSVGTSTNTTAGVAPDVATLIPNEYESAWVAIAVGFTLKEGDNLEPIARFYRDWGVQELASIADMGVIRPLPTPDRAISARSDV